MLGVLGVLVERQRHRYHKKFKKPGIAVGMVQEHVLHSGTYAGQQGEANLLATVHLLVEALNNAER